MSSQPPMDDPAGRPPTEEEMRAAYEAQMKQIRVEDLVVETIVSLLNLGGRRAGLVPGTEDERDPVQVQLAVDGAKALLPLVEAPLGESAAQLRDAIAQLQLAYVQLTGGPGGGAAGEPAAPGEAGETPPAGEGGAGPAQSSGRLWVPGS